MAPVLLRFLFWQVLSESRSTETRPLLDHKLTPIDGGRNADDGLFNKFKNRAWAHQMVLLLLVIDQDPVQMRHAEAALGALAELVKTDKRKFEVLK